MRTTDPKLVRTISTFAGIAAMLVAISSPLAFFLFSHHSHVTALEAEAEINSRLASQVVNANPDLWRFQTEKLEEFLKRRPSEGYPEIRKILDNNNRPVVESTDSPSPPLITRAAPLLDSGVAVGRIEISRSLRPVLLGTALAALLGAVLGFGLYGVMRIWPLRALDKALRSNAGLLGQTQQHLRQIQALHVIDLAITSTLDLGQVLEILLEKIDLALPYAATTVRLFNPQSGLLEPVACRNLDEREWKTEQWKAGRGTPNIAFESRIPLIIRDVRNDPRSRDPEFFRKHELVSYLGVPLIAKGEALGVLSFYTKEEHEFSTQEVEFLITLAGQAAIAIYNSQLYEKITKQAQQLEEANRAKDDFLSIMSHELKTPLYAIVVNAGMVQQGIFGEIGPEQNQALGEILKNSEELTGLINTVLDVSKLQAGKAKVERETLDLKEFLDDMRAGYSFPLGEQLSLGWDYPKDLPPLCTDAAKLKHVLQNLINNAIKYTERGKITVSACYCPQNQGVKFQVADTGIGIPEEKLPTIFEMFRQVDGSMTRSHSGVGLGLYIVKSFTEMLGGQVEVQSEPGKGSTFTVTLPQAGNGPSRAIEG